MTDDSYQYVEGEFRHDMLLYSIPYLRVSFLIASVLFIAGLSIDIIIAAGPQYQAATFRVIAATFYLVLYFLICKFSHKRLHILLSYIIAAVVAPIFILAVELSLPNGYTYLHSSILIVILAVSIIGPYDRISIPLIIAIIIISEGSIHTLIAADLYSHALPDYPVIIINTIMYIFAAVMAMMLITIDTNKNRRAFIEGRNFAMSAKLDELTQIYNRRGLQDEFDRELRRQKRNRKDTAILLIDIDFFKKVNDQHGHNVGDEVLQSLAKRWTEVLRETDTLARLGGEEFVVMLPESYTKEALDIAERLRLATSSTPIHTSDGDLSVTVSVGVSIIQPDQNDFNNALKTVDKALYRAKNAGRNRVELATDSA